MSIRRHVGHLLTETYGVGQVGGTIVGIPRGSPHPAEAWLLVSWMATDTPTLVLMANFVRNVPTTFAALEPPDLDVTPQFQTFLDIFANPASHYKPTKGIDDGDQGGDQPATRGLAGGEARQHAGRPPAGRRCGEQPAGGGPG
jgi:ABC-type glycerol-3-phosphate transport system substrate-binding protein